MYIKKRDETKVNLSQIAIYIYLINAICKYFLPNFLTKIFPVFALMFLIFTASKPLKIKLLKIDKPFVIFGVLWFLGCLYSPDITKGLGYVLSFVVAFLVSVYSSKRQINDTGVMKLITIMCFVLTAFIIIQPIEPTIVSDINHIFNYKVEEYSLMQAWTRNGWYSGLFPDRAPAAFFAVLLLGSGLYYLYFNKKNSGSFVSRFFGFGIAIIGVYGILMTAKRGLLVGAFIAAFVSYIVYRKANHTPVIKICIASIIVVSFSLVLFSQLSVTENMLIRFIDNDNLFTNRLDIYAIIFKKFGSSPFIGTGTASAFSLLGIGGHNIYLTVLMENGIIGFIAFVSAIVYSIGCSISLAMKIGKSGLYKELPFLLFALYIQIFFMIYGMSGNPLYDNYILYFYIFTLMICKNIEFTFKSEIKERVRK